MPMNDIDTSNAGDLLGSLTRAGPFVRTLLGGLSDSRAAWFGRLLRRHGHFAHIADDPDGDGRSLPAEVDLVIVEIDESEQSLTRCMALRAAYNIAMVGISGLDTEEERLRVLGAGCDDHLYWGCGPAEVMARVDAVLRWVGPTLARQPVVVHGPVRITPATREAWLHDRPIHLTHKEYELLRMLIEQEGQIVKRSDILQTIWNEQSPVASRSLDTHVSSLRRKFGRWICVTVRGYGVRMGTPGDADEAS
jgi:DNA-binding response OmpR family regulator